MIVSTTLARWSAFDCATVLNWGFLFEARQKRFTFDEQHFFVDLVFYNRLLQCYVLIDLKLSLIHISTLTADTQLGLAICVKVMRTEKVRHLLRPVSYTHLDVYKRQVS